MSRSKAIPRALLAAAVLLLFILSAFTLSKPGSRTTRYRQSGPTLAPNEQLIAFSSQRDDHAQIYTMNLSPSDPANISKNDYNDRQPAWSPDRDKIVFASDRDGNSEICVMDLDGLNQRCLTNNATANKKPNPALPEDTDPVWSPDGLRYAFVTNRDGNRQIYLMELDGSNQINISNNVANEDQPAWSPDLKTIAFVSDRQGNQDICIMDASGFNQRCLTNNRTADRKPSKARPNDYQPAWSPDSQKLVFTSTRDKNEEIYVMNADGSDPVNLTNSIAKDSQPAWSPDGTKILFLSDREGKSDLWIMNADGSDPQPLTLDTPNGDFEPAWQPLPPDPNATPTQTLTPTPGGTIFRTPLFQSTRVGITPSAIVSPTTIPGGPTPPPVNVVVLMTGNTGQVGQMTTWPVTASGGTGPYTFAQTNGTLPPGMNLVNSAGVWSVTGQPSTIGLYSFTLQATDSNGNQGARLFRVAILNVAPSPLPQGTAGVPYNATVTASDGTGTSTFTFSDPGGTLPGGLTLNPDGTITGTPNVLGEIGTFPVSVTIAVQNSGVNYTFVFNTSITIVPGAPATIEIVSGNLQSAQISVAYTNPLVVLVKDVIGNPVPGASVVFTAPALSGPSVTFASSATNTETVLTDSVGHGTTSTLTANAIANNFGQTFIVGASTNGGSLALSPGFQLSNTAGAPGSVNIISGNPQTAVVTTTYGAPLKVNVQDSAANLVPGVQVAFIINPAGNGASATFDLTAGICETGSTATTCLVTTDSTAGPDYGTATSAAIKANTIAGPFTVDAFVGGATTPSFSLTNTPAAPAKLVFITPPNATRIAGTPFNPTVRVAVEDTFGNIITTDNTTVISLAFSPVVTPPALLVGTTSTTVVNGIASFAGLSVNKTGSYTVTATDTGALYGNTTANFTITPAAADHLVIIAGNTQTAIVGGNPFATLPLVAVEDVYNNRIPGATVNFTLPNNTQPSGTTTSALSGTTDAAGQFGFTNPYITNNVKGTNNLTADSGAASIVFTGIYNRSGNAGTIVYLTQPPNPPPGTVATAGTPFPVQFEVLDQFGNLIDDQTISASIAISNNPATPVPGTLTGGGLLSSGTGIFTYPSMSIDKVGTGYTLLAQSGAASATSAVFNVVAGPATTIQCIAGSPQSATVNTNYATVLQVRVTDANGNPIVGASVSLTAPVAGASVIFSSTSTNADILRTTDATGTITSVTMRANLVTGSFNVVATSGALTTNCALTNTPDAAIKLLYIQQPTNQTAGVAIVPTVTVAIVDQYNNIVPTASATITLASTPAATFTNNSIATVAGVATFTGLSTQVAGTYTLTATGGGYTAATSNSFVISPDVAINLRFTTQPPATTTAGVNMATVRVAIVDQYNNTVTTAPNTSITLTSSPLATFTGTPITTAAGVATFTTLNTTTAGTYTFTASGGGYTNAISNSFVISPAAATTLTCAPATASATVGTAYAVPVTATVTDTFGNGISGVTITFNVVGAGTASVTLGSSSGNTGATGTFSTVSTTANTTAGTVNVTAQATGLTNSTCVLTNTPDTAIKLRFVVQPTNTTAGNNITPTVTVAIADQYNNTVTTAPNTLITLNSSPAVTFNNNTSTTAAGVATFGTLNSTVAGTYTLTASGGAFTNAVSNSFVISPAAANSLVCSPATASVTVGTAYPTITAQITDIYGNGISGRTINFTVPASGASVTLGTATGVTGATGTVSTTSTVANTVAGSFNVTAVDGLAILPSSNCALTNLPDVPNALVFLTQPGNRTAGTGFSPTVSVAVIDQYSNIVTGVTPTLITLTPSPFAAYTNTTATTASGIATFTGLNTNVAGTYTLTADATISATNYSVISNSFVISPAVPNSLVCTPATANVTVGTAYATPVSAQITDIFGNGISGIPVTFTAPLTGASVTLGSASGNTDATGTFSSITTTANTIAGSFNVTASGASLTGNCALTNDPGAALNMIFITQPTDTIAGQFINPAVQVAIADQYNNVVTTAPNTLITLYAAPPASFTSNSAMTSGGIATFTGLSATLVGTYNFTPLDSGLLYGNLPSASFNILPANPSNIVCSPTIQSTTVGTAYSSLLATVTDAYNNPVPNVLVDFTAPLSGPSVTPNSDSGTTNAFGIVLIPPMTANTIAGGFNVTASASAWALSDDCSLNNFPDSPAALRFNQQPANATAGTAISPDVTVEIVDQYGNFVSTAPNTTITLTSSPNVAFANNMANSSSGIATFTGLSTNVAGTYTLTASDGVLTNATSNSFTISPAAPNTIIFSQQPPASATAGSTFPIQVTVTDSFGNPISGESVTLAIGTNGGSPVAGTLSGGGVAVTNASGVATYSTVSINKIGTGYTLSATDGALNATSNAFDVTAGAPTTITVTSGSGQSAVITANFAAPLRATVTDANGNAVSGVSVTFTAPAAGASLSSTSIVVNTNASGVADSGTITANSTAGSYTVSANLTVGPLGTPANFSLTNTPITISGTVFTDYNANGVIDGGDNVGVSGLTVNLLDNANTFITSTTTSGTGTYSFSVTPGSYKVEFVSGGGYTVSFPSGGITGTITVSTGAPTSTGNNGAAYQSGTLIGNVYTDNNGNSTKDGADADLSGVLVELLDSGGTPLGPTVTTPANGNYSFTVTPGIYNVRFSLAGYFTKQTTSGINVFSGLPTAQNMGMYQGVSITGHIYNDANTNGSQNGGETFTAGANVTITGPSGPISAPTDAAGVFTFGGLIPGNYTITVNVTGATAYTFAGGGGTNIPGNPITITIPATLTSGTAYTLDGATVTVGGNSRTVPIDGLGWN